MNPVASGTPATDAYLDLRRLAAQNGRTFDELLQFYALEGFLTRLTESRLSDGFVNVGDPIQPPPQTVRVPRVLGGEPITMSGYPIAMVLAEKIVTATQRGVANTRWRDFADVWTLRRAHRIDGDELQRALATVAEHRNVTLSTMSSLAADESADRAAQVAGRRRQEPGPSPSQLDLTRLCSDSSPDSATSTATALKIASCPDGGRRVAVDSRRSSSIRSGRLRGVNPFALVTIMDLVHRCGSACCRHPQIQTNYRMCRRFELESDHEHRHRPPRRPRPRG